MRMKTGQNGAYILQNNLVSHKFDLSTTLIITVFGKTLNPTLLNGGHTFEIQLFIKGIFKLFPNISASYWAVFTERTSL